MKPRHLAPVSCRMYHVTSHVSCHIARIMSCRTYHATSHVACYVARITSHRTCHVTSHVSYYAVRIWSRRAYYVMSCRTYHVTSHVLCHVVRIWSRRTYHVTSHVSWHSMPLERTSDNMLTHHMFAQLIIIYFGAVRSIDHGRLRGLRGHHSCNAARSCRERQGTSGSGQDQIGCQRRRRGVGRT
jgi:hypothetical protein